VLRDPVLADVALRDVERLAFARPRFDWLRPAEADLRPVEREDDRGEDDRDEDARFGAAVVRERDPAFRVLLLRDPVLRELARVDCDLEDCFFAAVLRPRAEGDLRELDLVFDRPLAAVLRPVLRPDELAERERPWPDFDREDAEREDVEPEEAERPRAFVRPREPRRPEFCCSAVSRDTSLLKLLLSPPAVVS
jgi:hypothetical protein